jgi:hypothetical protein
MIHPDKFNGQNTQEPSGLRTGNPNTGLSFLLFLRTQIGLQLQGSNSTSNYPLIEMVWECVFLEQDTH